MRRFEWVWADPDLCTKTGMNAGDGHCGPHNGPVQVVGRPPLAAGQGKHLIQVGAFKARVRQ